MIQLISSLPGLLCMVRNCATFSDLLWEASFSVELNIDQIQSMKYTKPSLKNTNFFFKNSTIDALTFVFSTLKFT